MRLLIARLPCNHILFLLTWFVNTAYSPIFILIRRPSLPSLSAPIPSSSKLSTSSFTSKFAAHFSGSHSSKTNLPLDSRASSSRTSLISSPSSSGLAPPRARPSNESGSSTSRNRSTTPRGSRPVIMVSTTDNMDEFKDLFTKEIPTKAASKPSGNSQDSDGTQDSSPRSTPQSPESIYRRGQTPASVLAATVRDQQAHARRPSASSRNSRHTTDSEKSGTNEKGDGRTTPRPSSSRESPRPIQMPENENAPSRRPSTSHGVESSSSARSRMRPPSTVVRTKPPSIPLPDIPTESPATKPDGIDPSETNSRPPETSRSFRRTRSNTISSIPEFPSASSASTLPHDRSDLLSVVNIEDIDINTASPDHLRRALRSRNKQFEELTAYMLGREEAWSAERKALEKKINVLQRDLVRRDSEITGLKLIINDEDLLRRPKPLPGILNHPRQSTASTSPVQSDQEGSTHSHSRRMNYQSDSGPESARGSGNESSSSIFRLKKMHHRTSAIVGENYPSRTGSTMRLPKFAQNLQEKTSSESPYSKRGSMMSVSSSASSGASSLMPPSPSVTMSSLSAIPEGSSQDSRTNELEDRRALRASRRISASSMTSSSTAASSAYSTNIKRSRPPSIAQVLEKSPNIDDVLEKLRPFA